QAELGAVAGAGTPATRAACRQLHADAQDRPHLQLLGVADDGLQLGELLDDGYDVFADLAGEHPHLNELVILEAVADDRRLPIGQGEDGEQLWFGAGLQAELELLAEVEDLLDDLALLIDLDRINAAVGALVLELADGSLKGLLDLAEAVAED